MLIPQINSDDIELNEDQSGLSLTLNDNHADFDDRDDIEDFLPIYGAKGMHVIDIDNQKEFKKFVLSIERTARSSDELRRYIKYLSSELDLDTCSLLKNVSKENASIEIHHYPFTLYDLTEIVILETIRKGNGFTTFSLAKEVVELHFRNIVGLVPLSKTIHELAHSGEVFINLKRVFGDIKTFINEYKHSISNDKLDMLHDIINLSLSENSEKRNNSLLQVNRYQWAIGQGTGADISETLLIESNTTEGNSNV